MGKLHVKGWGYLNGKVACQGLRVGVGKMDHRISLAKKCARKDLQKCAREDHSVLLTAISYPRYDI